MEGASSTDLVILGLLKEQPAHGYELLRMVRLRRMREYVRIASSGMYRALARLEELGSIQAHAERAGNRPERQTYAITPRGETRLQELLREHLHCRVEYVDPLNAALTFGHLAPRRAIVNELRRRREMVAGEQEEADQLLAREVGPTDPMLFPWLVVGRWAEHLAGELRWLDRAIGRLEGPIEPRATAGRGREHP